MLLFMISSACLIVLSINAARDAITPAARGDDDDCVRRFRPPALRGYAWLAARRADPETGTVRVTLEGAPAFCNPGGSIQGGFLAAMLDETLGPTVLVKSGGTHYCATIDLQVSYLCPARPGTFTGIGRIVQMGKTVAFLEGELFEASGRCVARATASARVVPTTHVACG